MTPDEIKTIATAAAEETLAKLRNNCRCNKCGWVGAKESLVPTGSIARLSCPRCFDGYHLQHAAPYRWFDGPLINCDELKGCGDGTVYCDRRLNYLDRLKRREHVAEPVKPPSFWQRLIGMGRNG